MEPPFCTPCTLTKITTMYITLSFQQFVQKTRKCSVDTGPPHFWHANLVLFRCDGPQIWQRFFAVSGSWTCACYRWRQIRKCAADGGPHGGRQHCVALVTARHFTYFSKMKTPTQTCAFKNLWKGVEMQALAFFKIMQCWITTTGTHFVIGVGAGRFLGVRGYLPEFSQTCPKNTSKQ